MEDLKNFYEGKRILVTGGVGSIGSNIVRKVLEYNPKVVRVLDSNETGLFDLEQELQLEKFRPLVGDVRDKERLKRAVEDVDIIFHAAALKHVPLCEYNPFEAAKTNVKAKSKMSKAEKAALKKEKAKAFNAPASKKAKKGKNKA